MFRETLDRITEYFTAEPYLGEVKKAKDEYFRRTGKVFEEESMYERRMTAFLDWFLFDRVLYDYGVPPVRLYAEMFRTEASPEDQAALRGLERTRHSLYEFLGSTGEILRLRDVVDETSFKILERRMHPGFDKGDILDARLVTVETQTYLSEAIWVHPRETRSMILREVKRRKDLGEESLADYLLDLAYMKLKSERYRHVPAARIYTEGVRERDTGEMDAPAGSAG